MTLERYIVIRVNGRGSEDTYATEDTENVAWFVENVITPGDRDTLEFTYVMADNPGAARLIPEQRKAWGEPTIWQEIRIRRTKFEE